ncbi:hypothetical protein HZH68_002338 [Vespula germanica]|uniref:Uncharacterized protein n=1 Tax=Vespula germanica TaxID=30212 RepID=A0A834KZ94_VESGE|nr:hypothetical protein HZH68_002338 [Vespula germanica]
MNDKQILLRKALKRCISKRANISPSEWRNKKDIEESSGRRLDTYGAIITLVECQKTPSSSRHSLRPGGGNGSSKRRDRTTREEYSLGRDKKEGSYRSDSVTVVVGRYPVVEETSEKRAS